MKINELEKIFQELSADYSNLKAEVLLAELQQISGILYSDIVVENKSTFSRAYRRDILKVEQLDEQNPVLNIHLSRNGIYDHLPEGVFHSGETESKKKDPATQRRIQKKQEKDARSLFSPIESELFYQKLLVERNERKMLDDFYDLKDQFLIDFWKLDKSIPQKYMLKLIKILPFSYKIAGDLELARLTLARFLELEVAFEIKYSRAKNLSRDLNSNGRKKEETLGVDMVLESETMEVLQPMLDVTIGPVSVAKVHQFKNDPGMSKFLQTFYDYFLPMELDTETNYKIEEEYNFLLNEIAAPIMGVSARI